MNSCENSFQVPARMINRRTVAKNSIRKPFKKMTFTPQQISYHISSDILEQKVSESLHHKLDVETSNSENTFNNCYNELIDILKKKFRVEENNLEKDGATTRNSTLPSSRSHSDQCEKRKRKIKMPTPVKKAVNQLEVEAKSLTNSIEISNFYDYTKCCMKLIKDLLPLKETAVRPQKVNFPDLDPNKKLAVFDLDETLVHCVVKDYENCDAILEVTMPSKKIAKIGVNFRPNWEEAINRISSLYNIVVYTASHRSYADSVLNYLDPEGKYFSRRLYRNNCIQIKFEENTYYVKDMDIFEGFDLKNVVLIDNSVLSFAFDLNNGIPILPYYDAQKDVELLFCACYLESIADCEDMRKPNKKYLKVEHYYKEANKEKKPKQKKMKAKLSSNNTKEKRNKSNEVDVITNDIEFNFQELRNKFQHQ